MLGTTLTGLAEPPAAAVVPPVVPAAIGTEGLTLELDAAAEPTGTAATGVPAIAATWPQTAEW